jgi:hypothetical protein
MNRRLYGALVGALAVFMSTGAVVTSAGTASARTAAPRAAGPGVTLTARSNSITDGSPFSQVSVARACPANYQDNLSVYLVVPDGREATIAYNVTDGAPFSGSPVTAPVPAVSTATTFVNSISDAFDIASVPLADGVYPIHVVCGNGSGDPTSFPERPTSTGFIQVTGSTFQVASLPAPTVTTMKLSASPVNHTVVGQTVTLTAKVSPAVAGSVQFTTDDTNPIGTPAPVVNGVASVTAPTNSAPVVRTYIATFVPANQIAYAQAYTVFRYSFTAAPAIQVTDAAGVALTGTPQLTPGQHIKVSAQGFLPGSQEKVVPTISGSYAWFTPAATDALGSVTGYDLALPTCLTDGAHTLTLTGRTSHVQVTLSFTSKHA